MVSKMAERKKEILIVEDDAELRELLAQATRDISSNYEVKTAGNVDEAMVQVRRFQTLQKAFDLVITDIKMAGLTGLELLEVLHSIAPQTKTIVMTAYNSAELAERAQELNVYAYLTKPFVISEFRQIIQSVFTAETPLTAARLSAQPTFSNAQLNAVRPKLNSLRTMTGANATILLDKTGNPLVVDALDTASNLDKLGNALLSAQRYVEQQLVALSNTQTPINQSYFGSDILNVCLYRIDENYFVAVLFGPAVREGQVWYYLRDTVAGIKEALQTPPDAENETPTPSRRSLKDEYLAIVDQILSGDKPRRRRQDQTEPALPAPPPTPAQVATPSTSTSTIIQQPLPTKAEVTPDDLKIVEEIDWNGEVGLDWNDIISETNQGFQGMMLEEALRQGIDLTQIISTAQPDTGEEITEDLALLDKINWDVPVEVDWDSLVSETDKGLNGISLEEAQKRGLIDNLDVAQES